MKANNLNVGSSLEEVIFQESIIALVSFIEATYHLSECHYVTNLLPEAMFVNGLEINCWEILL